MKTALAFCIVLVLSGCTLLNDPFPQTALDAYNDWKVVGLAPNTLSESASVSLSSPSPSVSEAVLTQLEQSVSDNYDDAASREFVVLQKSLISYLRARNAFVQTRPDARMSAAAQAFGATPEDVCANVGALKQDAQTLTSLASMASLAEREYATFYNRHTIAMQEAQWPQTLGLQSETLSGQSEQLTSFSGMASEACALRTEITDWQARALPLLDTEDLCQNSDQLLTVLTEAQTIEQGMTRLFNALASYSEQYNTLAPDTAAFSSFREAAGDLQALKSVVERNC